MLKLHAAVISRRHQSRAHRQRDQETHGANGAVRPLLGLLGPHALAQARGHVGIAGIRFRRAFVEQFARLIRVHLRDGHLEIDQLVEEMAGVFPPRRHAIAVVIRLCGILAVFSVRGILNVSLLRHFRGNVLQAEADRRFHRLAFEAHHHEAFARTDKKIHGFQNVAHVFRTATVQIVNKNHELVILAQRLRDVAELLSELFTEAGLRIQIGDAIPLADGRQQGRRVGSEGLEQLLEH